MKKSIIMILLVVVFTSNLMTSCDSNVLSAENKLFQERIVRAELSEKEEGLLKAVTNRYLIFDVLNIHNNYKKINIWIERYENGELKGKGPSLNALVEDPNNNRLLLAIEDINNSSKDEKWIVSVVNDNGHSSASMTMTMPEGISEIVLTSVESVAIVEGETINLGAVVLGTGDSFISISSSFLEDETLFREKLLKNDFVYLLRCSFSQEGL